MELSIQFTEEPLAPLPPSFPLDGKNGAVVDFHGVVRGEEKGAAIAGLDYEAHRAMAEKELRRICAELALVHPCREVRFVHRLGHVPAGEPSLQVRVASPHRAEAFAFAQKLIDRMKEDVPIWKI
jgi:molybdopterin synthase catalytic subunit